MKLSKKERRYRMKIIQENNYNKAEQKILDEAAAEMPRSYKDIYEAQRGGAVYFFMAVIASNRVSRAFLKMGNGLSSLAGALLNFQEAERRNE